MSRAIYKPISFEDAARAMRENNTESLFIELEDGTLTRADCFRLEVGKLMAESWYLRCEQETQDNTVIIERSGFMGESHVDVCEYRPEVSD